MDKLPNECKCSKIAVHPEDWDQPGASAKEIWYIHYRFYDPIFEISFPKGKICIYKKGLNKVKTVKEKRLLVRKALQELTSKLQQGYNPITKITIPPPGEEIILPFDTTSRYLPIHNDSKMRSISINIDQNHMNVAKLLAKEIEKKELMPLTDNASVINITLLFPNTAFISALWGAYKKMQGVRGYLTDVRAAIRNITIAAYFLDFLKIPIWNIRRRHIKLCLELCGKLNPKWSNERHNKYRAYLLAIFKQLLAEDAVDTNVVQDILILKKTRRLRKILSEEERDKINAYLLERNYYFWRFVTIFFSSGCRETEMMRLQPSDVNIERREYTTWVLKGREHRQVLRPISQNAILLWKEIIEDCKQITYNKREHIKLENVFLFSKLLKPGLTAIRPDQLGRRWKKYVKDELQINVDFYSLKHLYSDLLSEQFGLQYAQRQNAHDQLSTTKLYAVNEELRLLEKLKGIDIYFASSNNKPD
ncbi:tyrosine-type recombinase/integrase [Chitinophaga oryziterrae]|uniref:Tyrosine-type recombinase/integrase n=1 Tax=Chitinophaga oryziterrae TaxID=1031224 RepID=A0A6N8J8Z1_9BACT|nr:tyrosine-type recombinase/integrase [Chitinophaga oryziterrae]MVT40766.1 tyrosine-type recombinase/integrase [Chitinophaga oryziterrae]